MLTFWGHAKPRVRRVTVTAVLAAVVLTGCGATEKLSPRVAVREAAKATANQKEASLRVSLVGSEADVNALFNDGAELSAEDRQGLDILRHGHIAISTGEDKFALDVKAGELDHAFELRMVGGKLYARADVAGLATLFGASPEEIDQTVRGLASQEGFGFLAAAAAGKWVVADFTALGDLFEGFGKQVLGATGGSLPDPKETPSEYKALQDAVGQALTEDISVKKEKSDGVGDHYVGTVSSLRGFYAKVRPAFEQAMGKLSGQPLPPASAVPDTPASLDIWIKSGRVARLEVDLAQFPPSPPTAGRVAIRVDIDRNAASVTAPPDAVSIDIAGLLEKFFGQFGELLEGLTGADFD